jgi:hypothetical protein
MERLHTIAKITLGFTLMITAACAPQTQATSSGAAADPKAPAPIVTAPVASVHYSTSSTLILEGDCLADHTIAVEGSLTEAMLNPPFNVLSTVCQNGRFYLRLEVINDGVYLLRIRQFSQDGVTSEEAVLQWEYENT